MVLVGVAYLTRALRLPWGTIKQPGAGFFPLIIGVLLLSAALGFASVAAKGRSHPTSGWVPGARRRVFAVFAGLIGFCLLLPVTGYPLDAGVFGGIMLQQLGASWVAVTIIALASAGISYYVFAIVLGVPLPGGILG
jgi:putative tricarboxylic transport membrane protein